MTTAQRNARIFRRAVIAAALAVTVAYVYLSVFCSFEFFRVENALFKSAAVLGILLLCLLPPYLAADGSQKRAYSLLFALCSGIAFLPARGFYGFFFTGYISAAFFFAALILLARGRTLFFVLASLACVASSPAAFIAFAPPAFCAMTGVEDDGRRALLKVYTLLTAVGGWIYFRFSNSYSVTLSERLSDVSAIRLLAFVPLLVGVVCFWVLAVRNAPRGSRASLVCCAVAPLSVLAASLLSYSFISGTLEALVLFFYTHVALISFLIFVGDERAATALERLREFFKNRVWLLFPIAFFSFIGIGVALLVHNYAI